jgi:valyl-tRNA synthetase
MLVCDPFHEERSMNPDLPKQYDPRDIQRRWAAFWQERGYFDADPHPTKKPHTIMIPLPNVTGALHMGHALNCTLQDVITRWRRMQGYEALWMPGTDHAGIATQAVVERRLREEEGKTRHDVGREELVRRIWTWKDQYESRILGQLRGLGASCDWRRTRFTLDEVCSRAVRHTFLALFRDDLVYRGKRLVNWDTHLQTAVADDEVSHETVKGHFWTFTYPVVGSDEKIAFSTTRPETMLGDTAVAVHPEDARFRHLIGRQVRIPLNGREIPIIGDAELVEPELGTGCVKVTPAHDPNDYACGLRAGLPMVNILEPDGKLNGNGGRWAGKDRYQAREEVVAEMRRLGHFLTVEDRDVEVAHSDRSGTPVEPYLSDQWFVRMGQMAEPAMEAVRDGRVRFFPARYAKTYLDWLGEKRDWCISRQLWWGHQIPVWYCDTCSQGDLDRAFAGRRDVAYRYDAEYRTWLVSSEAELNPVCLGGSHVLRRDEDVLDTWFSSALWPHETLGWPDVGSNPPLEDRADATGGGRNAVLRYFYPGSVLITNRDIITLWVVRMMVLGLYNMGDVPFRHVHVHAKILDGFGQTMSKSKGNGVDPMDLFDRYGVDAVRFTITSFAGENQDVRLPVGYECPHCGEVIPQTLHHQKPTPASGDKPRLRCPKCGKEPQYRSPWFEPDPGEPVARMVSERFEYGRNFCNKLWNAARFAFMNLEGCAPAAVAETDLELEDRWIRSRLSGTAAEVTGLLGEYRFDAATRTLRDFAWNEFCDWYVEMLKPRLRDTDRRAVAQRVLAGVLDALLRLLAPFIPFICEELWQALGTIVPDRGLPEASRAAEACVIARWPEPPAAWRDERLEARVARLQEVIAAVRNVRATYRIDDRVLLALHLRCAPEAAAQLEQDSRYLTGLTKAELVSVGPAVSRPAGSASFTSGGVDGFIPLEGAVNREAELARQRKEADRVRGFIVGSRKKLANQSFLDRAPPEVVEQVRETLAALERQLASIEDVIAALGE